MKKSVSKTLYRILSCSLALAISAPVGYASAMNSDPHMDSGGMDLYVETNGSANASGTLEDPLTLEGARDKIRAIKQDGALPQGGITVNILEGTYMRDKSLLLEEQDSGTENCPIIYQANPGDTVLFTGGCTIDGQDFTSVTEENIRNRLPENVRDEVLVYDLTENLGITEFAPMPKNGFGWPSQPPGLSVSIDGQSQTLSRYPNEGFLSIDKIWNEGFAPRWSNVPEGSTAENWLDEKWLEEHNLTTPIFGSTAIPAEKYDLWAQETDIWTGGYFGEAWADDNLSIKDVELEDGVLKLTAKHPSYYGVRKGPKCYAYNLLCEIDEPGEWYLDRETGKLYLYPEKDIDNSMVDISMLGDPFILTQNTEYIEFKNLDFAKSNGSGMQFLASNNMLVAGCSFTDLGQLAVIVGDSTAEDATNNAGAQGGSNNVIQSCDILRTGQGGIYLSGGNRYTLEEANSKVINCTFDDFATIKRTYAPAIQLTGVGLEASNNVITNAPHMAIGFNGNEIKISNNDISNVCYETSDAGAIYSGRTWTYRGVEISNNYIHDMISNGGLGSAGVYIDDMGCGATIVNNLFVNMPGYITLIGGGSDNTISNNILLHNGNTRGFHYDSRGTGWYQGNIDQYNRAEWETLKNHDLFDKALWSERYPELLKMDDGSRDVRYPYNAVMQNNIAVTSSSAYGNVSGNAKDPNHENIFENNKTYPAYTDIGFVNPNALDFHVKDDSIITETMGTNHFDVSQVGLYEDEYRSQIGTEVEVPVLISPTNGAENIEFISGVSLKWNAADGAASYLVEISDSETFSEVIQTVSVADSQAKIGGLSRNTTYYWRVTAIEGRLNGNRTTSDIWMFKTTDSDAFSFYEGFGDPEFSGWKHENGSPTRTAEQAHTGKYSYLLDEGMDSISCIFEVPQKETVTLWLYDNMRTDPYTTVAAMLMDAAVLGIHTNSSKDHYVVRTGSTWDPTPVPRSLGWHELKWDYSDGTNCNVYIDQTLVKTIENSAGYSGITIGDWWNDGSYAGNISGMMFDDLQIGMVDFNPTPISLTLNSEELALEVGKEAQLIADLETDIDMDIPLIWHSSVPEVATVSDNGHIVADYERQGETIISVYPDGFSNMKATCRVIVGPDVEVPPESVVLNQTELHLNSFESYQLNATVLPNNADNQDVIWNSSDSNVAVVDSDGTVYAMNEGEAVITVTTAVGKLTAECAVTVSGPATDLLPNPSFEEDNPFTQWIIFPAYSNNHGVTLEAVQSEEAPDGEYYAKMAMEYRTGDADSEHCYQKGIKFNIGEKGANGGTTQKGYNIPLNPDETYSITADIKVEAIAEESQESVEVGLYTICRGAIKAIDSVLMNLSPVDGWQEICMEITPEMFAETGYTADSGQVEIIIGLRNTPENMGTLLVDDIRVTTETQKYSLNVDGGSGSGEYKEGTTLAIAAEIPEGYHFVKWDMEGIELDNPTNNPAIFTMPANNVALTAITAPNETVTYYTLTVNGGSGDGNYEAGTQVTATAEIPEGYHFVKWDMEGIELDNPNNNPAIFTMPANNVTLSAKLEKIPTEDSGDTNPPYIPPQPSDSDDEELEHPDTPTSNPNDTVIQQYASKDARGLWTEYENHIWKFISSTTFLTGWQKIDGIWYLFDKDGIMMTGWQQINGVWYYLKDWGGMATGWQYVNGVWYYLKDWGGMATGWQYVNGVWYYLKDWGGMATGWQQINEKWYYMYSNGAMAANQVIDGYTLGINGEMK